MHVSVVENGWKPRLFFYNSKHGHSGGLGSETHLQKAQNVIDQPPERII